MTILDHTREGRGRPAIVFVHGFGCARDDWRGQVEDLRSSHEVIAVDLGGHGSTPGTPAHGRIETHARDVVQLLDELGVGPAVLVGHSMGCRIVVEAASMAPDRVAGLVLVDGSRLGPIGSKLHEETRRRIAEIGYQAFVEPFFAQMFPPTFDRSEAKRITARAVALPVEVGAALFPDIGRWDGERFETAFAAVRVPLMAIQTTYTNPERQRVSLTAGQSTPYLDALRATVPGARIEVIADVGHFPQLEMPTRVNVLLRSFLAGVAPQRS